MVYDPELYRKPETTEKEVGNFESALAGLATGLWNIPKGFVSLGAELYDLVEILMLQKKLNSGLKKLIHLKKQQKHKLLVKLQEQLHR